MTARYSVGYATRRDLLAIIDRTGEGPGAVAAVERLHDGQGTSQDVELAAVLFEEAGETERASELRRGCHGSPNERPATRRCPVCQAKEGLARVDAVPAGDVAKRLDVASGYLMTMVLEGGSTCASCLSERVSAQSMIPRLPDGARE